MTATLHTNGHLHTLGLPVDFSHIEQAARAVAVHLKNVALFVAAPFIGLVYAMALPLVGLVMLATIAARAFAHSPARAYVRNVLLFVAAPLIGLAYAVALPLVGVAMIAKIAYQAYRAPVQVPEQSAFYCKPPAMTAGGFFLGTTPSAVAPIGNIPSPSCTCTCPL